MEKLIDLLTKNGYKFTIIVLVAILLFVIANAEKVSLLMSYFWGFFSRFAVYAKKKQISTKVSGTIVKSVKKQKLRDNIIPSTLKITWVNKENPDTFVKNNQVIVRIKQSSNHHENLVTAVCEYVNEGLLCNVKRYLNKDVMDAARILMTKKVIQETDNSSLTFLE